jgi:hypothetical protein
MTLLLTFVLFPLTPVLYFLMTSLCSLNMHVCVCDRKFVHLKEALRWKFYFPSISFQEFIFGLMMCLIDLYQNLKTFQVAYLCAYSDLYPNLSFLFSLLHVTRVTSPSITSPFTVRDLSNRKIKICSHGQILYQIKMFGLFCRYISAVVPRSHGDPWGCSVAGMMSD